MTRFFIALVMICASLKSQESSVVYLDPDFYEVAKGEHIYHRVFGNPDPVNGSLLVSTYYSKSGKLHSQGRMQSKSNKSYHGIVKEFWENGAQKAERQYDHGKPVGGFQQWHENGQPKLLGYWKSTGVAGADILLISQSWDSQGSQMVKDGYGRHTEQGEDLFEEGEIKNEVRVGTWTGKTNDYSFEETYDANGKLVSGVSIEANGASYNYDVVSKKPVFPGGMDKFPEYVAKNFRTPVDSRGGRLLMRFVIENDGSVKHPKVVDSIDRATDKAGLSMLRNMPRWTPAQQRGRNVKTTMALPITLAKSAYFGR